MRGGSSESGSKVRPWPRDCGTRNDRDSRTEHSSPAGQSRELYTLLRQSGVLGVCHVVMQCTLTTPPIYLCVCVHVRVPHRRAQVFELVPELKEFSRGEQNSVESLYHGGCKLQVLLLQQDVSHGVEDILCV